MLSTPRRLGFLSLLGTALLSFHIIQCSYGEAPPPPPFWIIEGNCIVSALRMEPGRPQTGGACVSSPSYPAQYGNNERCTIGTNTLGLPLFVLSFDTEESYDTVWVNGQFFSGPFAAFLHGVVPRTFINWKSDDSKVGWGWKICVCAQSQQLEASINEIAQRYDKLKVSSVLETLHIKGQMRPRLYEQCREIFDHLWRARDLP